MRPNIRPGRFQDFKISRFHNSDGRQGEGDPSFEKCLAKKTILAWGEGDPSFGKCLMKKHIFSWGGHPHPDCLECLAMWAEHNWGSPSPSPSLAKLVGNVGGIHARTGSCSTPSQRDGASETRKDVALSCEIHLLWPVYFMLKQGPVRTD